MTLIENWKEVVLRSHSMRAFYGTGFCLAFPELVFWLAGIDTDPRIWWLLGAALFIYGVVYRLVDQGIDRSKLKSQWILGMVALVAVIAMSTGKSLTPASESAVATVVVPGQSADLQFLAVAIPLVGKWEGLRLTAYQDIVGVWTVCYGETKGVRVGDTYSQIECDAMLAREIIDYRDRLRPSFTADTIAMRLPVMRDVAFTSTAYNVGVGAFGGSTAVKRLNAGNIEGACEALTWWNKAGGRVVRGLVNRRAEEQAMCMQGVA